MSNPYTRFGYADSSEEQAPAKSYGTGGTGKVKRRNPYTSFGYQEKEEDNKQKVVDSLLDQGWSFEDIARDTGLNTDAIKQYVDAARPGYGVKQAGPSNLSKVGGVLKGVGQAIAEPFVEVGKNAANLVGDIASGEGRGPGADELIRQQEQAKAVLPDDIQQSRGGLLQEDSMKILELVNNNASADELRKFFDEAKKRKADADKKTAGTALEVGSVFAGGGSLTQAARAGRGALLRTAAGTTAAGASGGAGYELRTNPDASVTDIAQSAAIGGAGGLALSGVASGLGAGYRALRGDKAIRQATSASPYKSFQDAGQAEDSFDDLVNGMISTSQVARDKNKRNVIQRFFQKGKELLNVSTELRSIDNLKARRQNINVSKLSKTESLEQAYDDVINYDMPASNLITKTTSTGDSVAKVLQKHAQDAEQFNVYRNAVAEKYSRTKGIPFRKDVTNERLEQIIKGYELRVPTARQDIKTLNEAINEARATARKAGAITDELDKRLGDSSDYTPVGTIKTDAPQASMGGRSATTGQQGFVRGLTGPADVPLDNSFEPVLNYIRGAYKNSAQARLSQLLLDAHKKGLIKGSKVLSEPGAKTIKRELREYSTAVRKQADKLSRTVKIDKRQARVLASEINRLNKEGLGIRLKSGPKQSVTIPKKTITIKQIREQIIDNAPKKLDDLKQTYGMKAELLKEYGPGAKGIEQMAADIYNGGWTQLMALNPKMKESTARSLANQILKKPTVKGAKTIIKEGYDGKMPSSRQLFKNLVEADPVGIERLQKKIALREPKLATKLDKVRAAQEEVFALKSEAKGARQATFEILDDSTTQQSYVRGLDENGDAFSLELPPELTSLLRGTDVSPQNPVMRMLLNVQRTFQTAWTGFANPVFNFVTAPLYDVAANVNTLVDNPAAFLRSFTPEAFGKAITGVRNSDGFQIALRNAGAAPQGGSLMPQNITKSVAGIMSKRNAASRTGYLVKNPMEFVQTLDQFSGKLGNATRTRIATGYYKEGLKRGLSRDEALKEAAFAFNNMAPNFNRVNELARNANAFIPYFTAALSGNRSMWQPILAHPGRAAAVYGGIASTFIGATAYNLSNEAGKQFYDEMRDSDNQYVLDNNYIIVLPTASKNDETGEWTGIIKIPIAPEYRNINKLAQNSTQELIAGESSLNPYGVASALFNTMVGGVGESVAQGPPILRTGQILAGSKATGSFIDPEPLVTGRTADLPKEEQMYPWTSNPAKFFSSITGSRISPIQADAIIRQFGSAGRLATGQSLTEQVKGRFGGAYTDSVTSQAYELTAPAQQNLSQSMKDAKVDLNGARQMAVAHNLKVDGVIQLIRDSNLSESAKKEEIEKLEKRKASLEDYALKKRLELLK